MVGPYLRDLMILKKYGGKNHLLLNTVFKILLYWGSKMYSWHKDRSGKTQGKSLKILGSWGMCPIS
jgi:hypothetical protein